MTHLRINSKLERLVRTPKAIKVAMGGRGAGKSLAFADIFCMKMETEGADIYCLREYQDAIKDSVHKVFKGSIQDRLKLSNFLVTQSYIQHVNGAKTSYKGASRNPDSLQSAADFKYSWFEEAHRASKDSIDKLLPTILRHPGAECWFSANPQSRADPFSQRFINPYLTEIERDGFYEDDLHLIVKVGWRDNPWWGPEQEALRQWDFDNRPRNEYNWIWEGKFNDAIEDSIILPEWVDAAVDAHLKIKGMDRGVRVGAFDPADEGTDDKAFSTRTGVIVQTADSWSTGDIDDGIEKAFGIAFDTKCQALVYDSIGVGAGVKVGLKPRIAGTNLTVTGFCGSDGVDDPDAMYQDDRMNKNLFKNKRAQFYWYLRERFRRTYNAIEKGEYIPPDEMISLSSSITCIEQLKSELVRVPRKRTSNNNLVQIMSKPEMKQMRIKSPNLADSVMMLFGNPPPQINGSDWGRSINE